MTGLIFLPFCEISYFLTNYSSWAARRCANIANIGQFPAIKGSTHPWEGTQSCISISTITTISIISTVMGSSSPARRCLAKAAKIKLKKTVDSPAQALWQKLPVERRHRKIMINFLEKPASKWRKEAGSQSLWRSVLSLTGELLPPEQEEMKKVVKQILKFKKEMRWKNLSSTLKKRLTEFYNLSEEGTSNMDSGNSSTDSSSSSDSDSDTSSSSSSSSSDDASDNHKEISQLELDDLCRAEKERLTAEASAAAEAAEAAEKLVAERAAAEKAAAEKAAAEKAAAAEAAEAAEKLVAEKAAAEKAAAEKAAAEKAAAEKVAFEKATAEKAAAEKAAAEKAAAEKAAAEKAAAAAAAAAVAQKAADKAAAEKVKAYEKKEKEKQKCAEELLKNKLREKEEETRLAVASILPILIDVETDQEIGESKKKLGKIPKLFLEQQEAESKKCFDKDAGKTDDPPHAAVVDPDDRIWEGLNEKQQQRVYR